MNDHIANERMNSGYIQSALILIILKVVLCSNLPVLYQVHEPRSTSEALGWH